MMKLSLTTLADEETARTFPSGSERKMEPTTRIELVTSSLPRTRSYQLSYVGPTLERETGIEPATNSLEGCDSTTELLPPEQ
jgi:hypothetical protein